MILSLRNEHTFDTLSSLSNTVTFIYWKGPTIIDTPMKIAVLLDFSRRIFDTQWRRKGMHKGAALIRNLSCALYELKRLRRPCCWWCLPCADALWMSVCRVLSLTCEIPTMMLNTGDKFQNRNCDKTFAVIHQLLNGSNSVCQNQTSIVNPCDLESGEEFIINSQSFFLYKRHLTTY